MNSYRKIKILLALVFLSALLGIGLAGAEYSESGGSNLNVNGGFTAFTGFNTLAMTDVNKALKTSPIGAGFDFGGSFVLKVGDFEGSLGLSYMWTSSSYTVKLPDYYSYYYGKWYYQTVTGYGYYPLMSLSFGAKYAIPVTNSFFIKPGITFSMDSLAGASDMTFLPYYYYSTYWEDYWSYNTYIINYSGSTVGILLGISAEVMTSPMFGLQFDFGYRMSKIPTVTYTNATLGTGTIPNFTVDFSGLMMRLTSTYYFSPMGGATKSNNED